MDLMPHQKAPTLFHTPDKIEWTFVETFSDYEKLQNFRLKNHFFSPNSYEKRNRLRFYCNRRRANNCEFMLLALKTTKEEYHVYKHGKHNHTAIKAKAKESDEGEEEMEEEEDGEEEEEGEDEEEDSDEDESEEEENEEALVGDGVELIQLKQEEVMIEEEEQPARVQKKIEEIGENAEEGEEEKDGDEDIPMENAEGIKQEEERKDDDEEPPMEEEEQEEEDGSIKQEVKEEIIEGIEENPFINSREETLKIKLENANEKVYKWMAGIETNEIGRTIHEWDKLSLLKMVEMADQEIREHPEKFISNNIVKYLNIFRFNLWLPWMKCAIPKCLPEIEGVRNGVQINLFINL
jgi:hypothetical protein